MCLYVDQKATASFKRNNRAKTVKVYKVLALRGASYKRPRIETPYYDTLVTPGNELRAYGLLSRNLIDYFNFVEGGAIHVYTDKQTAISQCRAFQDRFVVECTAQATDFIAKGIKFDRVCEAAYKAIHIPSSVECIKHWPTNDVSRKALEGILADCGHQAAI